MSDAVLIKLLKSLTVSLPVEFTILSKRPLAAFVVVHVGATQATDDEEVDGELAQDDDFDGELAQDDDFDGADCL